MKLRSGSTGTQADSTEDQGPTVQDRLREALRAATFGEFEVYDELGRGGMARVYLCYELALDRHVAIKVMVPSLMLEEGMDERFRREAKISASLSHPNIVPVYRVKQTEDLAFFVMKYIDGCTLNFVIGEHAPLPPELVRQLLKQIAGALAYAHERGVVHRDIKPANILIDEAGRAILTDFGIARAAGLSGLTATGASVGTPYYMSPEQCTRGEISGQSDQYALGVVAYQMLSGRLPFTGADQGEVLRAHLLDTPEDITVACPECPSDLARVVMRMLAKRPEDRWPTLELAMAELRADQPGLDRKISTQIIALARTGPVRPALPKPPISPTPSSRRNPVVAADVSTRKASRFPASVLVVGGLAVLLAGGIVLWRMRPASGRGVTPAALPAPADTQRVAAESRGDTIAAVTPASPPPPPPAPITAPPKAQVIPGPKPERASNTAGAAARTSPQDTVSPAVLAVPDHSADSASILLGTRNESAYLYVNNQLRLPQGPSLRWWKIPSGTVKLMIKTDGCTPWDTTITISGRDTARIGRRQPECPP